MRFKNAADVKFYLYRSEAKIDSLYSQIARSGRSQELREIKLGGIGLTYNTVDDFSPDLDDKLKTVIETLEELKRVGTIEAPNEYIRGVLSMRWGMYKDWGRPSEEPPLVYFSSHIDDIVLGLGGSTRHVEGVYGASSTGSRSVTPYLIAHLLHGLELPLEGWRAHMVPSPEGDQDVFEAMYLATMHLKGVEQTVEFFAKVLVKGEACSPYNNYQRTTFILGTPLYVSLSPPLPADLSNY